MSKSKVTKKLENRIWINTRKNGVFCCYEVTIGFGGNERVDYMTIDTKETVRCYEIKSSKQDFYSKSAHTFIGNFNYYVMTEELYEEVKQDIPSHIGVHNGEYVIKKPKKQEKQVDLEIILFSMIRSLSRDVEKYYKISNNEQFQELKDQINSLNKKNKRLNNTIYEERAQLRKFLRSDKDIRNKWYNFDDEEDDEEEF